MFKSRCRQCGHDNCHGITQRLSCNRGIVGNGVWEGIMGSIYKPWCAEYVPSDNFEFIEWHYRKTHELLA